MYPTPYTAIQPFISHKHMINNLPTSNIGILRGLQGLQPLSLNGYQVPPQVIYTHSQPN